MGETERKEIKKGLLAMLLIFSIAITFIFLMMKCDDSYSNDSVDSSSANINDTIKK